MTGGLAGHGAAWPLPTVTDLALHAALHRAGLPAVHGHGQVSRAGQRAQIDSRQFGSLRSAGPFPVRVDGGVPAPEWFFPRPADLGVGETVGQADSDFSVILRPTGSADQWAGSSLPKPIKFAVASSRPPAKEEEARPWLAADAFTAYLAAGDQARVPKRSTLPDKEIFLPEHTVGIGMDAATGTQDGESIYSAHYLRLREEWRLGVLADGDDKGKSAGSRRELIQELFPLAGDSAGILVGGQQRFCRVLRREDPVLSLPVGKLDQFATANLGQGLRWLVKWVLLSPAIWPEILAGVSKQRGTMSTEHQGGWLPHWIHPGTGGVLLRTVPKTERARRRSLNYAGRGYASEENASAILAHLVAAVVPKAIPVTGYALPHDAVDEERRHGGPKPTHLAVPAGAVYYFAAETEADATNLAAALNWHGGPVNDLGQPDLSCIQNRRSTLFGEKGFGLGVCGTWTPLTVPPPHLTPPSTT